MTAHVNAARAVLFDGRAPAVRDLLIIGLLSPATAIAGLPGVPRPPAPVRRRAVTAVLRFDHVWKGYRDLRRGGPRTLRGTLVGGGLRERRPDASAGRCATSRSSSTRARRSGVVGRNGAGKSTLLRLASQLGPADPRLVDVHPDSASVLNLGASFDLQLTGRENAYTAALVGGATSGESRRLVPEALRFAELEDFADAPVRTYSEGMKLRLAFGVIASRRPQLLILDEVLAVGDIGFREKCEARIAEMRDAGTSLVLASHSADEVAATCRRALWLHKGDVLALGDAAETVERYEDAARATTLSRTPARRRRRPHRQPGARRHRGRGQRAPGRDRRDERAQRRRPRRHASRSAAQARRSTTRSSR